MTRTCERCGKQFEVTPYCVYICNDCYNEIMQQAEYESEPTMEMLEDGRDWTIKTWKHSTQNL